LSFEEFVSVVSVIPKELECGNKFEYHSALSWEDFWQHADAVPRFDGSLQEEMGEHLFGELSWEDFWKYADIITHLDESLQRRINKELHS
jgi:hypothetical protein